MSTSREGFCQLDRAHLVATYSYDPSTGEFWQRGSSFHPKRHPTSSGYKTIKLGQRRLQLHRVIWFYVHGEWPASVVDHINGDKTDNRLENLRLANKSENAANSVRRAGRYGYRGVRRAVRSPNRPYFAALKKNGTTITSPQFSTIEEAARAYDDLARAHFGEFAVFNFGDNHGQ